MSFNDNDFNNMNNANNNGNMNGMNNMNNMNGMNNGFDNMSGVQNASYDQPNYSDFGDSDDVSTQNNFMSNPMAKKLIIAIAIIVAIILLILLFSLLFKNKKLNLDIPDVVYKDSNVEFIAAVANKKNDLFYNFSSTDENVLQFEYKSLAAGDSSNTLIPKNVGKSTIKVVAYDKGKEVGTYSSEVIVCGAFNSSSFGNDTSKAGVGDKLSLAMDLGTEDACYKRLKYSSSNDEVATVSNDGEVSALKAGNVEITVDNGYTTLTKKITVVATGNVTEVSGVKLNTSSLTVEVGKSAFLYATVSPSSATNKSVVWTSSNDNVAMVSNKGQVVGLSTGSAVITATTQDGNKTAMAKVTVKKASGGSSSTGSSTGGSSGSKYRKVTKVTISSKDFALMVGKTKTLSYAITPKNATNKKVTWKSSNPAVAKISTSGKVTGVGPGTATISAVSADGVSSKIKVTVTTGKIVKATGLTLSPSSLSINIGQSKKVTATVTPKNATIKTIKWVSLNSKIARVSSAGTVTGVSAGTTTITAVTTDGAVQKSLKVTVRGSTKDDGKKDNKNVEVTGLLLSQSSVSIKKGSSTTVTATVVPDDATNKKVTWKSSNTSIATVSNGKITGVGVGSTTVVVSAGDVTEIIEVTVNSSSGINCELKLTNASGKDVSSWTNICTSKLNITAKCTATGTTVKSVTIDTDTNSITSSSITSSGMGTTTATKKGYISNTSSKNNGSHTIKIVGTPKVGQISRIIKTIKITGNGTNCKADTTSGNSSSSSSTSKADTTKPYIPASGGLSSSASAGKMTLSVTAADSGSGVASVTFYYTNKSTKVTYHQTYTKTTYPKSAKFSHTFNTAKAGVQYSYYVVIKDKAGNVYKSSAVDSKPSKGSTSSQSSSSGGSSGSKSTCTKSWKLVSDDYSTSCKASNNGTTKVVCDTSKKYKNVYKHTGTCTKTTYRFIDAVSHVCTSCPKSKVWVTKCNASNVGKYKYSYKTGSPGSLKYYGNICVKDCSSFGDYKTTNLGKSYYCSPKGRPGKDSYYITCGSNTYVKKKTYSYKC